MRAALIHIAFKTIVRLVLLALAVAAFTTLAGAGETKTSHTRVTLLLICDIYQMSENRDGRGGMARVAAVIRAERARGGHVIVAHAGDTLSPSLMSGLDQGAHMIDLLNMINPDFFVPGNHEYDFGPEVFRKRMSEARFNVYAANLAGADGKPLAGIKRHRMFQAGPVRIALIGLTADDSPTRSSPGNLKFASSTRTAVRLSGKLRRAGADLIVLVPHASRPVDNALIAGRTADIILSGDDHDLLLKYDGRQAFVEAMQDGLVVAAIDLDITIRQKNGRRKVTWHPRFRFIDTAGVTPDPEVLARVVSYEKWLSKELDVAVGTTTTALDSRNAAVRGGEAAIGNLFADAVRAMTGADIVVLNGGGFRGNRRYPPGSAITRRHILAELPFGNQTFELAISGADLRAALEQGFAKAEQLTGRFPQVSGMTIRADLSAPAGARIRSIKIAGVALDDRKIYRLATNDFLARGGDGYSALTKAKLLVGPTDGKLIANHVMAYLVREKTVSPVLEGRVIVGRQAPAQ